MFEFNFRNWIVEGPWLTVIIHFVCGCRMSFDNVDGKWYADDWCNASCDCGHQD